MTEDKKIHKVLLDYFFTAFNVMAWGLLFYFIITALNNGDGRVTLNFNHFDEMCFEVYMIGAIFLFVCIYGIYTFMKNQ